MALARNFQRYNVVSHRVHDLNVISQTSYIPSHLVLIELRIDINLLHDNLMLDSYHPFFPREETLCFSLNTLRNPDRVHLFLDSIFIGSGINIFSASYDVMIQKIIECGLEAVNRILNNGNYCKVLNLRYKIDVEPETEQETLMATALAESNLEFERINYGMVAAEESSVEEMLKKVRVEAGDDETCMICLEDLEFRYEASGMPCCHLFHGDCIEKWLKQSHYCPICRFEMPTN